MLFWFSKKQSEHYENEGGYNKNCAIIDGDEVVYTECREETIDNENEDLWEDSIFLGRGEWGGTRGEWKAAPKPIAKPPEVVMVISNPHKEMFEELPYERVPKPRTVYIPKQKKNHLFLKKGK